MVKEDKIIEITITKEMKEEAMGLIVQRSLQARSLYESKTNEELEEIIRFQILMHYWGTATSGALN